MNRSRSRFCERTDLNSESERPQLDQQSNAQRMYVTFSFLRQLHLYKGSDLLVSEETSANTENTCVHMIVQNWMRKTGTLFQKKQKMKRSLVQVSLFQFMYLYQRDPHQSYNLLSASYRKYNVEIYHFIGLIYLF
jgi:hypothetical protein